MKNTPWLLALILLIGACGSDENSDGDADDGGEDSELTSSPAEDTDGSDSEAGDSADADGNAEAGDDETATSDAEGDDGEPATSGGGESASELGPDTLVVQTLGSNGVEVTDETVGCIEGRGADPTVTDTSDSGEAVATALAIFACVPEKFAAIAAANVTAPTGTDTETVECVLETTYRFLGELPPDEGAAALASPQIPAEARAVLAPIATEACDVTADQVSEIVDQLE